MNASNPSPAASPIRRITLLAATIMFATALTLPASQAMATGQPSSHKGAAHKQIILQHHHARSGKGAHKNIILQHHHH